MSTFDTGAQFNFTYAPGVSVEQMIGFEMAGEFWSQQLADNVTINIFVEMTDYLPENVIGGALPGIEDNIRYADYRTKLGQDVTSDIDSLINYNQPSSTDKFTAYFDAEYDSNGHYKVDNNEYIKMTRANAKALELINPHDTSLDGYILMRDLDGVGDGDLNQIQWDYSYGDNQIASNSLDFLSVAIHEIGHTLGFISGLDQANWLAGKRNVNANNEANYYNGMVGNLNNATPVDMLRFSSGSNHASGNGNSWVDMTIGGNPYLSFDGGQTTVAYFATGRDTGLGGDGDQASHWKQQENAVGIMDPVLGLGQRRQITQLDTQLFDAIGWDMRTDNSANTSLSTIYTEAKEVLVEKITTAAQEIGTYINQNALSQWVQGSGTIDYMASLLTPNYVDSDGNNLDDRGEALQEMIVNSGDVYEWGWQGYWWGWQGYWWGWQGYWQSTNDFDQDGFWQNLSWQNIDLSDTSLADNESLESDITEFFGNSNILQSESYVAEILVDNYLSKSNNDLMIRDQSDDEKSENIIEEVAQQVIDNSKTVISQYTTLDLDVLGSLLSEKLEDVLKVDEELLVMPLN